MSNFISGLLSDFPLVSDLFQQQSDVKNNNVAPLIFLVITVLGDHGKLVSSGVPGNHLAFNFADSSQLLGGHPEHLHLGPSARQQLSIGREVDVVFFKVI